MKRFICLLLSVISAVGAPVCFHYGWLDAFSVFIVVGALSFTILAFSIAKEYADWVDKNNNGYNPFID